uniref:Peptidase S1 domain-containing protein n=1 Tax=Dendroctonus ponderosae TaxID=77166 RepID=A0AAR5QDD3_DENPD
MRINIIIFVVITIQQSALGIWEFWKLENMEQFWKRKHISTGENDNGYWRGITGGVFVALFGYPSNCQLKGASHACTFSVACWWAGGSSQSGCGANPWIFACCVTQNKNQDIFDRPVALKNSLEEDLETRENIISQSIQRRNDIWNDFDEECGISNDRILQKRIIGGKPAEFGQFPWQAYIKILSYQCGGVLVSRKFVATAAHCILPAKLTDLLVYLGELDTQDTGQVEELAPAELHRVKRRLIHPKFHYKSTQPDRYDLALLELVTEASFSYHITPICLPDSAIELTGREAVVAGWGKTEPQSKQTGTNVLRSVSVPILDISECMAWHKIKQIVIELHPEMLCAGYKLGKQDACLGDSGGPLILLEHERSAATRRYRQDRSGQLKNSNCRIREINFHLNFVLKREKVFHYNANF